jgi:hypothetical protein
MAYADICKEKLSRYKIEGQTKPFIDKDLQLQLPGSDENSIETPDSFNPIYSHYMGVRSPSVEASNQQAENEIYQAMADAKSSYEAWEKMQANLKKAINDMNQ